MQAAQVGVSTLEKPGVGMWMTSSFESFLCLMLVSDLLSFAMLRHVWALDVKDRSSEKTPRRWFDLSAGRPGGWWQMGV